MTRIDQPPMRSRMGQFLTRSAWTAALIAFLLVGALAIYDLFNPAPCGVIGCHYFAVWWPPLIDFNGSGIIVAIVCIAWLIAVAVRKLRS